MPKPVRKNWETDVNHTVYCACPNCGYRAFYSSTGPWGLCGRSYYEMGQGNRSCGSFTVLDNLVYEWQKAEAIAGTYD